MTSEPINNVRDRLLELGNPAVQFGPILETATPEQADIIVKEFHGLLTEKRWGLAGDLIELVRARLESCEYPHRVAEQLRVINENQLKRRRLQDLGQELFSNFIWSENIRLNRLIANLYMKFTLESLPDEELFEGIAHNIAEYFHAEACQILLARQEFRAGRVITTLRMYGAFGPWERAMKSPFVRHRRHIEYQLPSDPANCGNVVSFWASRDPDAMSHRGMFKKRSAANAGSTSSSRPPDAIPHQQAWLNRSLGTTSRNIVGCSLISAYDKTDESRWSTGEGVICVENRRPQDIQDFRPAYEGGHALAAIWRLTAIRPYVRYLQKVRPDLRFRSNEVGWRRLYGLSQAQEAFQSLSTRWYEARKESGEPPQQLLRELGNLGRGLDKLTEWVTTAETFLQHLRNAIRYLDELSEKAADLSDLPRSVNSFFNIANIHSAWRHARSSGADGTGWVDKDRKDILKCIDHAVQDAVQAGSVQAASGGTLEVRVVSAIYGLLGWRDDNEAASDPLKGVLGSNQAELSYDNANQFLLELLRRLATRLVNFPVDSSARTPLAQQEYTRLRRRALRVLRELDAPLGRNELGLSAVLADTLAAAAMDAHTFGDVDKARLLFISRRVAQLMDNRIIFLGHKHKVAVNHHHMATLRIDDFALECLNQLRRQAALVVRLIERAILCWFARTGALPKTTSTDLDLPALLNEAVNYASSGQTEKARDFILLRVSVMEQIEKMEKFLGSLCQTAAAPAQPWQVKLVPTVLPKEAVIELALTMPCGNAHYYRNQWLKAVLSSIEDLHSSLCQWIQATEEGRQAAPVESRYCHTHLIQSPVPPPANDHAPETQTDKKKLRLQTLRKSLDDLISSSDEQKDRESRLSELAAAIADVVEADSAAIFLVENAGGPERMVMQGASGRLSKTLQAFRQLGESEVSGVIYNSCWTADLRSPSESLSPEQMGKIVAGSAGSPRWPLTNQLWHLGDGKIANLRADFKAISEPSEPSRAGVGRVQGLGNRFAYPPEAGDPDDSKWTLKNIFRTFIGIPIFARGGSTDYVPPQEGDAVRTDFLSQYRVTGILKIEGKWPQWELFEDDTWWAGLDENIRVRLERVFGKGHARTGLRKLYEAEEDPDGYGKRLLQRSDGTLDSDFVDRLTEALDARWQAEDVELLVAIAMEIGRLEALKTLHDAVNHGVYLGENDIGILDVRKDDVQDIVVCNAIAEKVTKKVEFELNRLRIELNNEKQRSLDEKRDETHEPMLSVESRVKVFSSLFRKLTERQVAIQGTKSRRGYVDLGGPGLTLQLPAMGDMTSPSKVISGLLKLRADRLHADSIRVTYTATDLGSDLRVDHNKVRIYSTGKGLQSAGAAQSDRMKATAAYPLGAAEPEDSRHLCSRIFDSNNLNLEDWAGARVRCAFVSDLFLVLDGIRARFPSRGITIDTQRIEEWLEMAQPNGYRAVHLIVMVPLKGLVSGNELSVASRVLGSPGNGDPVSFPCEIQLRTSYQDSWAQASHQIQYKRPGVRDDLRLFMGYLSGLLYQSDSIMELVRQDIEAEDSRHVELLSHLRRRLPEPAFALVLFGAFLAKHVHKRHSLYGGQPHYTRLVDVGHRLVHLFQIDDPFTLLVAFLRDLWLFDVHDPTWQDTNIEAALVQKIDGIREADNSGLLDRLACRTPKGWSHRDAGHDPFGPVPDWFFPLLSYYRSQSASLTEIHKRSDEHLDLADLEQFADKIENREVGKEVLKRGYVVEAATRLSRLAELPLEPLPSQAIEELDEIYASFERIRRRLGPEVRVVLQKAEQELRACAEELGVNRPIDWES